MMNFKKWLESTAQDDIKDFFGQVAGGLKNDVILKGAVLYVQGRVAEADKWLVGLNPQQQQQLKAFLDKHFPQNPQLTSSQVYADSNFMKQVTDFIKQLASQQPQQFSITKYLQSQGIQVEKGSDGVLYTKDGKHAFHFANNQAYHRNRQTGKMTPLPAAQNQQQIAQYISNIITNVREWVLAEGFIDNEMDARVKKLLSKRDRNWRGLLNSEPINRLARLYELLGTYDRNEKDYHLVMGMRNFVMSVIIGCLVQLLYSEEVGIFGLYDLVDMCKKLPLPKTVEEAANLVREIYNPNHKIRVAISKLWTTDLMRTI